MLSAGGNDGAGPSSSSSAPEISRNNKKNKGIARAPNRTSLLSLNDLMTFRPLISPSKSNSQNGVCSDDDDDNSRPPAVRRYASTSSGACISNHEDLLLQILLPLPPKSLIRFQCVSRQWFSLISSSHFCRLHSGMYQVFSPEVGLFLYRRIYGTSEFKAISLLQDDSSHSIGILASRFAHFLNADGQVLGLHCCNGLMWVDFYWNYEVRRYYVYNPTTNQYRQIPIPEIDRYSRRIEAVNIVFDPLTYDQYKLVCVFAKLIAGEDAWGEFIFWQYSSETQAWKDCGGIDIWDESNYSYYFKKGVFWDGNLYWVNSARRLLCFDLDLKCVRSLNVMNTYPASPDGVVFYFGNSGGSLHLIDLYKPRDDFLNVFELEVDMGLGRYHSRWLLKYRVDLGLLTARYPLMSNEQFVNYREKEFPFGILCFQVDKKANKAKLIISLPGKIISYEISDMIFEELVEIEPAYVKFVRYNMSIYTWKDAFNHFEILSCV
ncbi:F-box protein At5g07610-like [Coffea eugenioides]|uniref:F-box protein At5g07610 n=1 Tax=Coffea arabica TaxID=13443 RepID=A0A6P6T2D2_COFAR|nr:F-box protein At5g07610-like [Coffea arabica]XP_027174704.1 F-box protein At5g07610-like [Coffea eugenioides]